MQLPEATHPIWELLASVLRIAALAVIMWINTGALTQNDISMLLMFAMFGGGVDAMRARALRRTGQKR